MISVAIERRYDLEPKLRSFLARSEAAHHETEESLSGCRCLVVTLDGKMVLVVAYETRRVPLQGEQLVVLASHREGAFPGDGWSKHVLPVFDQLAAELGLSKVIIPVNRASNARLYQRCGYQPGVTFYEKKVA